MVTRPMISVIIPSALRTMPQVPGMWLWRAIRSVTAQTLRPHEIIVGLDPRVVLPDRVIDMGRSIPVSYRNGSIPGHQAAMNAAAAVALSPLLAFLEDDDEWAENHLELLAQVMKNTRAAFVSTSQLEVDAEGKSLGRVFDYPTASGWLMTRLLWMQMKGFDTRFKIHHDNEFLGRLNARGEKRAHVIEDVEDSADGVIGRPHLRLIAKHAQIVRLTGLKEPTVRRTVNAGGSVLDTVGMNPVKRLRSGKEYAAIEILFGDVANSW